MNVCAVKSGGGHCLVILLGFTYIALVRGSFLGYLGYPPPHRHPIS